MSKLKEKITINYDTNYGFNEDIILFNIMNNSFDFQTILNEAGEVIISGTDDFMYKLGQYLVGIKNDSIKIEGCASC